MTAVAETPDVVDPAATDAPGELATWPARAGAFAIDVLAGTGLLVTLALLAASAPLYGWFWWVCTGLAAAVGIAMLVNRIGLAGVTGWSLGRSVFGLRVVLASGSSGAGLMRLLLRDLAHLLDTAAVCVGWVWPLWDSRHRTFADLLTRTEVQRVPCPPVPVRARAGAVLVGVGLLAVVVGGLGYFTVYRADRAVEQTREQLAEQGPRMVEQLLSFGVDSVDEDFARAQSLVTDNYRQQLITQQDAVREAGATTNDYWAVSSAVLSEPAPTGDRGSMVLALQGQRGTNPEELQFITATVQVEFSKSGGHWLVDNLTVLKRPALNGGAS